MLTSRRQDEAGGLIERDEALETLRDSLSAARAGRGRTTVISGPPGIGKTRVLDTAVGLAREGGLRILRARGSEAEQDFPFSGALQLLETSVGSVHEMPPSLLSGSAALARPVLEGLYLTGAGGPVASAVHGLFWLTVNLSAETPLALLIDDLHALDEPTLAYLLYLHRRIADLPIALLAATRPAENAARTALSELVYDPAVRELPLLPLSVEGVSELVRAEFEAEAEEDFCHACAKVSGGNPFYLKEALRSLQEEGTTASHEGARRLSDVEPHAVTRSVLLRLARLDTSAHALARACAILGPGAPVALAAEVAGLELTDALPAADALAAASILEADPPLRFVHALIGAALAADIPAGERAALHARAADLLMADHAPADRIAMHLLSAPPARDAARVEVLSAAAENALQAGVPGSAIAYLRRALAEPPAGAERRAELLGLLTQAEIGTDPVAASEHLREARRLGISGRRAAELQLVLGRALYVQGAHSAAAEAFLEGAAMLAAEDPLSRELTAWFISASVFDPSARERALPMAEELAREPPSGLHVAERAVLAQLAVERILQGRPLREVRDQVELAWGEGALLREETADGYSWMHVTAVYLWGGDFVAAEAIATEVLRHAQERGSVMAFATASYIRACAALWQGRVLDALADVEATLEVHARDGWSMHLGAARYVQAEALLAQGEPAAAAAAVSGVDDPRLAGSFEHALLLYARARVHLVHDRLDGARADLERAREISETLGLRAPQLLPVAILLADVLARSGRGAEAAAVLRCPVRKRSRCLWRYSRPDSMPATQMRRTAPTRKGLQSLRSRCCTLH